MGTGYAGWQNRGMCQTRHPRILALTGNHSRVKCDQPAKLYELLTAATKAHNSYTRDASTGKGCDRHFMGLKLMMREGESHPLLDDPLFQKSQDWILSTSGLSAGDRFYGTGFGTVWPNGYGTNCESSLRDNEHQAAML